MSNNSNNIITKINGYSDYFGIINYLIQINNYYGGVFVSEDTNGPAFNDYFLILHSSEYNSHYISFSFVGERTEDEDIITYYFKYNDSRIPAFEDHGDVRFFYNDIIKNTFHQIDINLFLEEAERIIKLFKNWDEDLLVLKLKYEEIKKFYKSILNDDDFENIDDIVNYFYVNKQIFDCRFYGSTSLELTNCDLETIPENIKSLDQIENLIIANNYLQDGIEGISSLHNLKQLELFNNMISELPSGIGSLKNLKELIIEERFISTLLEEIGLLKNLRRLTIKGTSIYKLPESICNLTNIEELLIVENKNLEKIPDCIACFQKLTHLYLYNNNLSTIPDEVGELENLKVLNLSKNKLYYLPKTFSMLSKLEKLDVSKNRLDLLEKDIFDIESLNELIVNGNIDLDIDELYTIMLTKKLNDRINLIT